MDPRDPPDGPGAHEGVAALPASAQRVYGVLFEEGPLTHRELVELSGLPARTVRFAVAKLRDHGMLGVRSNLMDSRQQYFFVPRT